MNLHNEAFEYFKMATELAPNNYSVWVCFAIALSDAGDSEKAMELYKHAIEIDPAKPNAYILLANILINEILESLRANKF